MRAIVLLAALIVPLSGASAAQPDLVRSLQWQINAMQLNDVHKRASGAGIVVAVIDSGVDALHPDLSGQVLQGPDTSNSDIDGRGTGLAGLIAGHGHGAITSAPSVPGDQGILGVAPSAKILPIAFAPAAGENGDADRMATGVELAINRGAQVICIGRGVQPSERLEFAIGVAVDKKVLVVTVDSTPWPTSYPGVLSAVPSDRTGAVRVPPASGRTTGLAVPGIELMTTDRSGGYRIADTSSAAAILAGAAAVLWSANPDATGPQIADVLRKTASPGSGGGVSALNLPAAMNAGVPKPLPSASPTSAKTAQPAGGGGKASDALVDSTDWRRWLAVLPLIFFMVCLAAWSYYSAKRRDQ